MKDNLGFQYFDAENFEKTEMVVDGGRNALGPYANKHIFVKDGSIEDSSTSFYHIIHNDMFELREERTYICYVPPKSSWKSRNALDNIIFEVKKHFFLSQNH